MPLSAARKTKKILENDDTSLATTRQEHIFIDTKLSIELDLEANLKKGKYKITRVDENTNPNRLREKIKKCANGEANKIHLIAHGSPGHLKLGLGLTLQNLEELTDWIDASNPRSKKTIIAWGCKIGKQARKRQSTNTTLITSSTDLGQQKTLPGHGPLTKLIYQTDTILSSPNWSSKGNSFRADKKPTRDPSNNNLWSIGPKQGARFWGKINAPGIQLPRRTLSTVEITSPTRNFEEWSIKFNPQKDDIQVNLPTSLIKAGTQDLQVIISGKNKKIDSWEATIKPQQSAIPLLNWRNKIKVNYDRIAKSYGLQGHYLVPGILKGKGAIEGIKIKNRNVNNPLQKWSITGNYLQNIEDLGLSSAKKIGINYSNEENTLSLPKISTKSSSDSSIFGGRVGIQDLILEQELKNGWTPKSWIARGELNFKPQGFGTNPDVAIRYQAGNGATEASYIVETFNFNATSNSLFSGNVSISDLQLAKGKDNNWGAQSWEGAGTLSVKTPGISLQANTNIRFQSDSSEFENKDIIIIESANLQAGSNDLLKAGAKVKDLIITKEPNNSWQIEGWNATGNPNLNSEGIKITGEVNIDYRRFDENGNSSYTISEASIDQSAPNGLMQAGAKAIDVVITKNKKNGWDLQQWVAVGKLNVPIQGINLAGSAEVAFKKSDTAKQPSQFTVKEATIKSSKDGIFKAGATINNLQLTTGTSRQWIPQSWQAFGELAFTTPSLALTGDVNVSYSNDEDLGARYQINQANIALDKSEQQTILSGNILLDNAVLVPEGKSWTFNQWQAQGNLTTAPEGLGLSTEVNIDYFRKGIKRNSQSKPYPNDTAIVKDANFSATGVDSIFQGRIDLTELQITKDENNQWNSQYWLATGFLNLDLSALSLDTSSEVDARYYREKTPKTDVPRWEADQLSVASDTSKDPTPVASGTFLKDTVYAKGNFAVGSGSIFSGNIELAEMQVTKDESGEWSPQYWLAAGSLDLGLSALGLKASSTVKAAYYRGGTPINDVPAWTANQSDNVTASSSISSTGNSDEILDDTVFAKGSFEAEDSSIFKGTIDLNELQLTKDDAGDWSPRYWNAGGEFGINISGLELAGKAQAIFYRNGEEIHGDQEIKNDTEQSRVAETDTVIASGSLEATAGIFAGGIDLHNMQINQNKAGKWTPSLWNATGSLDLEIDVLNLKTKVNAEYYKSGTNKDYDNDVVIVSAEPYKITGENSLFKAGSEVTLQNLVLERNNSGDWEATEWKATGEGQLGAGSLSFDGSITVGYEKGGERNNDSGKRSEAHNDETYFVEKAEFSAEGQDIFKANIEARDIILKKNSNNKWQAESWQADAKLALPGLPIKTNASAEILFNRDQDNEIFTVNNANVDISLAGIDLEGNTAMRYIKNDASKISYWDYIVGNLKAESGVNVGSLNFKTNGNLGFSYGELEPVGGVKRSIYGINGSLAFDQLGGPLKYLEINAGGKELSSNEVAIETILKLKERENFDQLSDEQLAKDTWHFGNIAAEAGPLNLGFVEVGTFGAKVSGSVGKTDMPYGLFKYNDEGVNLDSTKGTERALEIFAKDVTLEMGSFANTIAPIAQGINAFTKEAKTPLNQLTQKVSAFNQIPTGKPVLDLQGDFIRFVKDFPNNPRKGSSDVLVIELMDKVIYLASLRSDYDFYPMTPVVTKAKEFVDNIDLLSNAAGSRSPSIKLPDLQYSLNMLNETSSEFLQKEDIPQQATDPTTLANVYGIPTMAGNTAARTASTSNSSYANLTFPVMNDVGGLLKKVFLTPEEPIDIAEIDMGLKVGAKAEGQTPGILSANFKVDTELSMNTALQASISMNDAYNFIEQPEDFATNFGNLILKGSSIDLKQTNLNVKAGVTIGAGINVMSAGCLDLWFTKICSPGVGASVDLGVHGNIDVKPVLRNPDGDTATNQTLNLYNLLNTSSARNLFKPNHKARTNKSQEWKGQDQVSIGDGLSGDIRSRLVDYEAIIDVDFKNYLNNLSTGLKEEEYLNVNIEFSNPLYVNKKTLSVSRIPGKPNSSIPIKQTGWLTTPYSLASIAKSYQDNKKDNTTYKQYLRFNNSFTVNQYQQTFKEELYKSLNNQPGLKSRIRRNIHTIVNRVIASASPEKINVALANRHAETLISDRSEQEKNVDIKIYKNGEEIEVAALSDEEQHDLSKYTIVDNSSSSNNPPGVSIEYAQLNLMEGENLQSSFDIGSQASDPMSDLHLEIIDSKENTIANLGSLKELTGGKVQEISEPIYQPIDSDAEGIVEYEKIEFETNSLFNVGVNVTKLNSDQLDRHKVNLIVVEPSNLNASTLNKLSGKINPENFSTGDYRWKISNKSEDSNQIGLANFSNNTGFNDFDKSISEIVGEEPSIFIDNIQLKTRESYDSFSDLLKDVWAKRPIRNQLLGSIMANVPEQNASLKMLGSAIDEKYSIINYENHLNTSSLAGREKLNSKQSLLLGLESKNPTEWSDFQAENTFSKYIHPSKRTSDYYDLDIDINANIYLTIGGTVRLGVTKESGTWATFDIWENTTPVKIGRVNNPPTQKMRGEFTVLNTDNENSLFIFSADPLEGLGSSSLSYAVSSRQLDQYSVSSTDLEINEISTLYAVEPIANNKVIAEFTNKSRKIEKLIQGSLIKPNVANGLRFGSSINHYIYTNDIDDHNKIEILASISQFNSLLNNLQAIIHDSIKTQKINLSEDDKYQIVNGKKRKRLHDQRQISAMDWAYNAFIGYMYLLHKGEVKDYNNGIAKALNDYLQAENRQLAKIDFSDPRFLKDFLTFSNILLSNYTNSVPNSSGSVSKQVQHNLLNDSIIDTLSKSLSIYSRQLAHNVESLAYQASNKASLAYGMAGLKNIDDKAREKVINYVHHQNKKGAIQSVQNVETIVDDITSIFDQTHTLQVGKSTFELGNRVLLEADKASSMRRDKSAYINISTLRESDSQDTLIPITVSTTLQYGKDKDFYFQGNPYRPPSNINIKKQTTNENLIIKKGKNADNIENGKITVQIEQPLGQILRAGNRNLTYELSNGKFSTLGDNLTPLVARNSTNKNSSIDSLNHGKSYEGYTTNGGELTASDSEHLGLASYNSSKKMTKAIHEFSKISGKTAKFSRSYYTINESKIEELISDPNYILISSSLYYVSEKAGKDLSPVYQFTHKDDKYHAIYSLNKLVPNKNFERSGIAWYTKKMPNSLLPTCSTEGSIQELGEDTVNILDKKVSDKNLSTYINLNKVDGNNLRLNVDNLSTTLDLNGFSNNHEITFLNYNTEPLRIQLEGNSIVINDEKVVRLWGDGKPTPNASQSTTPNINCQEKGDPFLFIPSEHMKTLNINESSEVKAFKSKISGETQYTSNPQIASKLHQNYSQFEYNGVAFSTASEDPGKHKDIFKFTNNSTGQSFYSPKFSKNLMPKSDLERSEFPAFNASTNPADGLEGYRQIRNILRGTTQLVNENDLIFNNIQSNQAMADDGVIFYAKPLLPRNNTLTSADQIDVHEYARKQNNSSHIKTSAEPLAINQNYVEIIDTNIVNNQDNLALNGKNSEQKINDIIEHLMMAHQQQPS